MWMKISRICSLVSPLVSAPRMCSFNSCGRLRIAIIARLSMLRSFLVRPGRPQPAPQQYSLTNSWNGRLKSSAFFIEFSTYSLPSTSVRMRSPVSNVSLSMLGSPCVLIRNGRTIDERLSGRRVARALPRTGERRSRIKGHRRLVHNHVRAHVRRYPLCGEGREGADRRHRYAEARHAHAVRLPRAGRGMEEVPQSQSAAAVP